MEELKNALVALTEECHHFYAPPNTEPAYIVWKEDGRNDLAANNAHEEKAWTGTVELYTRNDNDPLVSGIDNALDSVGAVWSLISVDYEYESGLIHYSWDWEL